MQDFSKTSLRDMLYVLFRFKWLVISLFLLVVFGGIALTMSAPRIYEATSTILISFNNTRLRLTSVESNSRLSVEQQIFTEIEYLKSWGVIQDAIENLKEKNLVSSTLDYSSVIDNLRFESIRNTTVIAAAYRDRDPQRARDILNGIIEEYIAKRSMTSDHSEEIRYREMLDDLDSRIANVEDNLASFRNNQKIFDVDMQLKQESTILERLRGNFLELQRIVLHQSATLVSLKDNLAAFDPDGLPSDLVNDDPSLRRLLDTYNQMETAFLLDRSRLTEDNVELMRSRENLKAVEKELEARFQGSIRSYEARLGVNETELDLIGQEIEKVERRIQTIASSTGSNQNLQKRLNDLQSIRTVLSQKLEETRILARGEDRILYKQVSPARAPLSPKSPNVRFNLILSLTIGLVLSLVTPFYVQLFDARIVSDTDVKTATGRVPILSIGKF